MKHKGSNKLTRSEMLIFAIKDRDSKDSTGGQQHMQSVINFLLFRGYGVCRATDRKISKESK
jgi:hypothetical protein